MAVLLMPMMINVGFAAKSDTKLYISPKVLPAAGVLGHPGDVFPVEIKIDNIQNLWSAGFKVTYAPYARPLVVGGILEGDFMKQDGWETSFVYKVNSLKGELSIGITRIWTYDKPWPPVGASGSGTLATFNFAVVEAGDSDIGFSALQMLDPDLNPIGVKATGGRYTGVTADLISMTFPNDRIIYVGGSFAINSLARNDGDSLLQVRTRFDIERLEDGRRIKIYSGQNYAGGGLGEPNPFEYVYASEYIAEDADWGTANDFDGGTGPWPNSEAVLGEPDGVYAESSTAFNVAGWYKFHLERAGRVVLNIDLYGYESQPDGADNDFDPYILVPCSDGKWRTAYCDSIGGSVDWAWTGLRYYKNVYDFPEYYRAGRDARDYEDSFNNMLLFIENYGVDGLRMRLDALRWYVEFSPITPVNPPSYDLAAYSQLSVAPFTINAVTKT